MAEFRKCFHAIDTENTGVITVEGLRSYMQRMHYKEQFVSKWISLFDPNNEGVITYESYCKTLGLIPKRQEDEKPGSSAPKPGPSHEPKPAPSPASPAAEQKPERKTNANDRTTQPDEESPSITEPIPPHTDVPKEPANSEPKPAKGKGRKSKRSQSEKSDEPTSGLNGKEVPPQKEAVEEEIVPSVYPLTYPMPQGDQVEAEPAATEPSKQAPHPQKTRKPRTGRKSTSSQSEEVQPAAAEQMNTVPETKATQPQTQPVEPMEVDHPEGEAEQTKAPAIEPTKAPKHKGRKHKHSQSKEEPEHLTPTTSPEVLLDTPSHAVPGEENLIQPVHQADVDAVPPPEAVHEPAHGKERKGKRHKSHSSQSEQVPEATVETVPTETVPNAVEQPMEVEAVVTPAQSVVHPQTAPEMVTETPASTDAAKPAKAAGKSRKSKRSQSDSVEETPMVASVTQPTEESAITQEEQETGKKAHRPKKPRAKKSSQSHSESIADEETCPPDTVGLRPAEVDHVTPPAPATVLMQAETKQSITPLLSPSPIPPDEHFVCIGQVDNGHPNSQLHDVTQEMEVQHLTSVESVQPTTNRATVAPPAKEHFAPMVKSKQPEPQMTAPVPAEEQPDKPKEETRKKQDVKGKPVPVEAKTRAESGREKTKPKETPKPAPTDQAKARTQAKESAKPEKVKQTKVVAKAPGEPEKKKAEKRKHEETAPKPKKEKKQPELQEGKTGKKKKSKDPTLERLERIRRPVLISARRLKDRKPVKPKKVDETSDQQQQEQKQQQTEKQEPTSRFPRSFMVQLDGVRSMRQKRLILRQHERRLQRKIDRLEKVRRKSRKTIHPKYRWKVRPSLRSRGVIVILLGGPHRGKRVVCLGRQRSTGLLLVTGPFRYNGCPLRRVHPNMVIATQTSVDLRKFAIPLRMHKKDYFARKKLDNKRQKLDETLLLKSDTETESAYTPSEQRKADQKLIDAAVCKAIKAHEESRMVVKYLKSLFSLGKRDYPHRMVF